MSNWFTSIRFVMALLTVLAIVGKPFIPPKSLLLHPTPAADTSIYGPPTSDGEAGTYWLDKSHYFLRCEYGVHLRSAACGFAINWTSEQPTNCGKPRNRYAICSNADADPDGDGWSNENGKTCVVLNEKTGKSVIGNSFCATEQSDPDGDGWGFENEQSCLVIETETSDPDAVVVCDEAAQKNADEALTSINAKGYDGLSVRVHYEGRAQYLRLGVIDADPALLAAGKKPKPMATLINTEDLRAGPLFVPFRQLTVEEWWSIAENPTRQMAGKSFNHIVQVGIDNIEPGIHRLRVDEIRLVGERISHKAFLISIVCFWAIYLLVESAARYYQLRAARSNQEQQMASLGDITKLLEQEKAQIKNRTMTDPLTGVYNRNGFMQRLQELFGTRAWPAGTGLLVLDIDHFKKLNDTYGHDAGDQVLQEFAQIVSATIRNEDVFARWGGEEFILLVTNTGTEKLQIIAEKLRERVAHHYFLPDRSLRATVSIGVAQITAGEHFAQLFKRADTALYDAKKSRNKVSYAL